MNTNFKFLKRLILSILMILILTSCDWYLRSQIGSFRSFYYSAIQNKEYDKLSKDFHLPDSISDSDKQKIQNRIAKIIRILSDEYGTISHNKDVGEDCKYHIYISALDTVSLKKIQFWGGASFYVIYSKSTTGKLAVDFYKESWNSLSILELRYDVQYLNDSIKDELYELGASIKTTETSEERFQKQIERNINRFGDFYSQAIQIVNDNYPYNIDSVGFTENDYWWFQETLSNLDTIRTLKEFEDKVYWIYSFQGEEKSKDIKIYTDKMSHELWDGWEKYNKK